MACFIAPTGTAIIVTAIKKKIPRRYHVEWLLTMLWGGNVMLIVDHILSGELLLFPLSLTKNKDQIVLEIIRVGIPMTIAVFAVWMVMIVLVNLSERKKYRPKAA